jgi:hypothetical protein
MLKVGDDVAGIGSRKKWGSRGLYSFTASNEAFLGMTSSMKGSKPGYVSSSFWRRPRCTEDLTLDRLLGGILDGTHRLAGVLKNNWWLWLSHRSYACLDLDCWTAPAVPAVPQNRGRCVLPFDRQEVPNKPLAQL